MRAYDISMTDTSRFAERVAEFLTHDVEVAKLESDQKKQYGAWYNQDGCRFQCFCGTS